MTVAYSMTVTEAQLRTIQEALEWYGRLRMGQWSFGIVEELVFQNTEPKANFDVKMDRVNSAEECLRAFMEICRGHDLTHYSKTPETETALDMWSAIRHYLWTKDAKPDDPWTVAERAPIQLGPEPLPKIEEVSE